jgi:DNA-binding MarR family transcriptional regulator
MSQKSNNSNNEKDSKYTKYIPFLDSNYNLVMLLGLTINTIVKSIQQQVADAGLTAAEYELLILANELGDEAIPAELSRLLLRKPPATTTLLNRMEKTGFVKRKAYPDNKKVKIVTITKKGQEALNIAKQHDVLADIIGEISPRKFKQLWDLLEELKDRAAYINSGK